MPGSCFPPPRGYQLPLKPFVSQVSYSTIFLSPALCVLPLFSHLFIFLGNNSLLSICFWHFSCVLLPPSSLLSFCPSFVFCHLQRWLSPPHLIFLPFCWVPVTGLLFRTGAFLWQKPVPPFNVKWGLRKTKKWPRGPGVSSQPQCCLAPMGYSHTWNSMIFYGLSVCCQAVSSRIPWVWIKKKGNKSNCWKTNHRRNKVSAQ